MDTTAASIPVPSKKIILVAEDDETVQQLCLAILKRNGFEYILTAHGAEALEVYERRSDEVSLILSDVSMPVMTGIQLFRRVLDINPNANVILMSGYSVEELIPEELQKLCSVLQKPFTSEVFISAIKKCLKYDDEHHAELTSA